MLYNEQPTAILPILLRSSSEPEVEVSETTEETSSDEWVSLVVIAIQIVAAILICGAIRFFA